MAWRVTLRVSRPEEKKAGWSGGGRCRTKKMFSVQGKSDGYCAPPMRKRDAGRWRAGAMNSVSSIACRSAASDRPTPVCGGTGCPARLAALSSSWIAWDSSGL